MAMILLAMGLVLLLQGCLCSVGQINRGCMKWKQHGDNVCCEVCHPGNRLVETRCGPSPKDLCSPCEPQTFIVNPMALRCTRCTQCVGAQIQLKECTPTTDTKCGCKKGLTCGDDHCSFCVKTCDKGQEPTEKRSCRPCPDGTFNDQIHQMCKPWSTRCRDPNQKIVAKGDAFTDIKCGNDSVTVSSSTKPDHTEQAWPLVLSVITSTVLIACIIIIIINVTLKIHQKRKKTNKTIKKKTIIRTPTDDPTTLIAIECSFHEAQQEQGSSSESLASKDSSEQLIAC